MQFQPSPEHSWTRKIPGTTEAIGDAGGKLHASLLGFQLSDELIYAVELCFEELTTNILHHGRKPGATLHSGESDADTSTHIDVSVENYADRVTMIIEDNTPPFDITSVAPHSIDQPLANVKPGGLGIHLIHQFSSSLRHERTGDGNRVTVEFRKS